MLRKISHFIVQQLNPESLIDLLFPSNDFIKAIEQLRKPVIQNHTRCPGPFAFSQADGTEKKNGQLFGLATKSYSSATLAN
ncbi:hypothetical protein DX928_07305 [Bacillus swezeyi]|uniref:Uncharacterized protein n=1 Tax=Bacillus swezeyi TaxID=1925020 RepID=A0A5M8S1F9_9BACI|nr:hypothetical protein DX927_04725 [Bacillus swezeyi]KAA6475900.1 hypothetical protein DX928_07305 [Bacillus swezeyi]